MKFNFPKDLYTDVRIEDQKMPAMECRMMKFCTTARQVKKVR